MFYIYTGEDVQAGHRRLHEWFDHTTFPHWPSAPLQHLPIEIFTDGFAREHTGAVFGHGITINITAHDPQDQGKGLVQKT